MRPRLSKVLLTATALLTLISGSIYGAIGPAGFWIMAGLCAAALPIARRL